MSNIISADFYRVRRGAALRNTLIALFGIILLAMVVMLVVQSDLFTALMTPPADMTIAEIAELETDVASMQAEISRIDGGAAFGLQILGEFIVPFLFLPVILAVFCADFSAGTYRNALSYESDRTRVYMAKLALSVGLCLAMVLAMLAASWLLGGIAFGFSGFSAAYFDRIGITLLLQLPIYLAFITVCHFLVAFTKKSSSTIAFFFVGYIIIAVITQVLSGVIPALSWMACLDPQASGKIMAMYDMVPTGTLMTVLVFNLGVTIAATVLGLVHFRKADMP